MDRTCASSSTTRIRAVLRGQERTWPSACAGEFNAGFGTSGSTRFEAKPYLPMPGADCNRREDKPTLNNRFQHRFDAHTCEVKRTVVLFIIGYFLPDSSRLRFTPRDAEFLVQKNSPFWPGKTPFCP
jgi:hypothetical protein